MATTVRTGSGSDRVTRQRAILPFFIRTLATLDRRDTRSLPLPVLTIAKTQSMIAVFIVGLCLSSYAQKPDAARDKMLGELADAERAFAAETVKLGFRDGFIKYFADDGIGFGPHPERTREKLMKSPPATGPRRVIFNWAPMYGDISYAGDLGYTTGPVLFTDVTENPKPPWHGMYFSVWQKQADGTWKVVIDMGIDTPTAVAPIDTKFTAAGPVGSRRPNPLKGTPGDDYRGLDWNLWGPIAKTTPAAGYGSDLDKQFRVHRKGVMPVTDSSGLVPLLTQTKFEFIDGKIASSGDLAFTYGKYSTVNDANGIETGYYVHVWRRDADSKWRLVVDVQNPLPKSDK
jgi:ketosteroid isomerase-like protein